MTANKYYFYRNPLFKVYATIQNGLVKMDTEGLVSPVFKTLVKDLMQMFDGTKPSKVGSDRLIYSTWMPPIPSKPFDRLVSSQLGNIRGKYIPEQLTISITEDCPNKCLHCALPDTSNRAKLEPNVVRSIIDQAQDLGTTLIIFDGGEPLLYAGLEGLISYVDQQRTIPGLFTSGVGLTKERAQSLKEAGLYMLSVSLDSANEEGHDIMRGRAGVFKDAMSAIRNGIEAGLLVNMYVVISPRNIHELDDFYKLARETGVHEISFFEIVPTGRWLERTNEVLSAEDRIKFDDFVLRANNIDGPRIFPIPHIVGKMGCFAGRKWLHITPEGNVWPCSCLPLSYGNIHDDTLRSIWKNITNDSTFTGGKCLMRNSEFRRIRLDLNN
ncbi:radical SAM protein [uncultured Methanomethylovorans sp.]|uniref:radical SAM/SPASM domain-containing protein n=1 Tax=uncultured Methanomethylovorans sp. TaxID=183759 RepID=UPI002AA685C8|nr:radical SAM protein [uncultured Methanomethylovorans sp.]